MVHLSATECRRGFSHRNGTPQIRQADYPRSRIRCSGTGWCSGHHRRYEDARWSGRDRLRAVDPWCGCGRWSGCDRFRAVDRLTGCGRDPRLCCCPCPIGELRHSGCRARRPVNSPASAGYCRSCSEFRGPRFRYAVTRPPRPGYLEVHHRLVIWLLARPWTPLRGRTLGIPCSGRAARRRSYRPSGRRLSVAVDRFQA